MSIFPSLCRCLSGVYNECVYNVFTTRYRRMSNVVQTRCRLCVFLLVTEGLRLPLVTEGLRLAFSHRVASLMWLERVCVVFTTCVSAGGGCVEGTRVSL